jgi:hypothetical protein
MGKKNSEGELDSELFVGTLKRQPEQNWINKGLQHETRLEHSQTCFSQ